jgi:hypothetical protein
LAATAWAKLTWATLAWTHHPWTALAWTHHPRTGASAIFIVTKSPILLMIAKSPLVPARSTRATADTNAN